MGCGVLSDGSIFYTYNGRYLGSSINNPEDPKIHSSSQVFSTLFVDGFCAHLKVYYDRPSFVFNPQPFQVSLLLPCLFHCLSCFVHLIIFENER